MKTFMAFIVSVAVVCFCFFYYLQKDAGRRPEEPELAAVAGEVRANMALAAAPVIVARVKSTSSVTLIAQRGRWRADTVRYMNGGYFFQQVLIKFDDGILIEHTGDSIKDNTFFLLNRRDCITGPGQDRMLFVLDSIDCRLVWREIIRDGKPMKAELDTLRVQFLLLRRPQS